MLLSTGPGARAGPIHGPSHGGQRRCRTGGTKRRAGTGTGSWPRAPRGNQSVPVTGQSPSAGVAGRAGPPPGRSPGPAQQPQSSTARAWIRASPSQARRESSPWPDSARSLMIGPRRATVPVRPCRGEALALRQRVRLPGLSLALAAARRATSRPTCHGSSRNRDGAPALGDARRAHAVVTHRVPQTQCQCNSKEFSSIFRAQQFNIM